MGELKKWAGFDKSGQWWNFNNDGDLEAIYDGFSIEDGQYGEAPVYRFRLADGDLVKFQSKSKGLARQMDGVEIGTGVIISREGAGSSTTYEVEVV